MPSNPTTKSQVHAYKFVLRRMQSALVRKDAVMLHDPMRTHSRATMVGVVLSALGVLGFIIFGLFKPAPEPPDSGGIVIGEDSGQVYVSTGDPQELIPTFNLASARLLMMKQQSKKDDDEDGGDKAPNVSAGDVEEADVVPDDELVDIPRRKPQGIPFGPSLLPDKDQRISTQWGVCEDLHLDPELPTKEAWQRAETETTVVAGMSDLGHELKNDQALLVRSRDDKTYLVYRLPENANHKNSDVVRAEIDLSDATVTGAYGLANDVPRKISNEMLDSIPETDEIAPPKMTDKGSDKWHLEPKVGDAFSVEATDKKYYVLTEDGKQKVSKGVADLVAYSGKPGSSEQPDLSRVPAPKAKQIPTVSASDGLDVEKFPRKPPTVLNPETYPSACLGWHPLGKGKHQKGHTTLYVNGDTPVPSDKKGHAKAVDVSSSSPDGYKVDQFYMPQGRAAVVRSVTSKHQFGKGPIQLVSDLGVRYGVPNAKTASWLGLQSQDPAPERILRLLPVGPSLNMQNANQEWPSSTLSKAQGSAAKGATHD